jgi:hypothetical protein
MKANLNPPPRRESTPAADSGLKVRSLSGVQTAGRIDDLAGLPGQVQPVAMHDPVTGIRLEVRTSELFTVVSIDGRDFYFDRLNAAL